jgi:hypothetical protein
MRGPKFQVRLQELKLHAGFVRAYEKFLTQQKRGVKIGVQHSGCPTPYIIPSSVAMAEQCDKVNVEVLTQGMLWGT